MKKSFDLKQGEKTMKITDQIKKKFLLASVMLKISKSSQ